MKKSEKVDYIMKELNSIYPSIQIPLNHENIFELLIAVLLSAQCTDDRVNSVTPILFSKANKPSDMQRLSIETIYEIIKPCGLGPKKSKAINSLSKILVRDFNSKVPCNLKDLESLPGVGHKTASVVISQGFGKSAFPVDTHIHRLAQRWGLTSGINVTKTETDLKKIFPETSWKKLHLQMIYYGRDFCTARSCYGLECKICKNCYPNRKKPIKTKKA
tara:strand:+ start:23435 stop:24088 length:654 start_codon:yes stop_codon:yes gene_type:complete